MNNFNHIEDIVDVHSVQNVSIDLLCLLFDLLLSLIADYDCVSDETSEAKVAACGSASLLASCC